MKAPEQGSRSRDLEPPRRGGGDLMRRAMYYCTRCRVDVEGADFRDVRLARGPGYFVRHRDFAATRCDEMLTWRKAL